MGRIRLSSLRRRRRVVALSVAAASASLSSDAVEEMSRSWIWAVVASSFSGGVGGVIVLVWWVNWGGFVRLVGEGCRRKSRDQLVNLQSTKADTDPFIFYIHVSFHL